MTNLSAPRVARLTKRTVDLVEPAATRFFVWDDDLKGFGLRVEPTGVKTFVIRYRVGGGRRGTLRQYKIGRLGKLTPDQARDAARSALAQVEMGRDPQAERDGARRTLTVAELCDLYLAEGVETKKASTVALDRIRIAGHIKPLLGSMRITDVERHDVERVLREVGDGKVRAKALAATKAAEGELPKAGSRVRGGKGAASRTVGLLSGIFSFALGRKMIAANPARAVKRFKDVSRERFLSPAELGRLGDVLAAEAVKDGRRGAAHVAIVRLLCLTGARKNEIARLRRTEVDAQRARLALGDSKTGAKVIRLAAPALQILTAWLERPNAQGSPYVFPDPEYPGEPVRGLDWAWVRMRTAAGLSDLRIHDLRHSYASIGVAGGASLQLLGKLLGHAHIATTHRYAHLADDPISAAGERIAAQVDAAMTGASGEVDQIRGRA